jgi:putative glycosyltransferase
MMTGLAHARGDHIFLIDSDLEEEPEWLLSFFDQMSREGCDVVYGVQTKRKGGLFERWSGQWFYRIFRALTGLALPDNVVTARLMTRRYVDALLRHDEREFDIGGLWYITGFEQHPQIIKKHSTSETTYTLRRKISLFVNSVTSFSSAPLVYIFYTGLTISFLSGIYTIYLVIQWIFLDEPLMGWTSIMASIWLLGGWIILFIGIIGIYLSKVFMEIKRRPYTIVRQIYGGRKDERSA